MSSTATCCPVSMIERRTPPGSETTSWPATVAEPSSGRVSVDGRTWQDDHTFVPAWKRRVGLVFQDQALFPHLDVRGNLDFAIRRAGPGAIGFDETVALVGAAVFLAAFTFDLLGRAIAFGAREKANAPAGEASE